MEGDRRRQTGKNEIKRGQNEKKKDTADERRQDKAKGDKMRRRDEAKGDKIRRQEGAKGDKKQGDRTTQVEMAGGEDGGRRQGRMRD